MNALSKIAIDSALVPVQSDFEPLRPYLVGEPRQFLVYQGETFCVRAHPQDLPRKNPAFNACEGCPHLGQGCEIADERPVEAAYRNAQDGSTSGMEPHPRRGIGMEERSFLVLTFLPGHSHATLPRELWDNPYADKAMQEENLHYLLTNPRTTLFHTIKGQMRFYGTAAEFEGSAYAGFLQEFDAFVPTHHPISMDKSAIEPRVCTLVTGEPRWLEVFQGQPKVIFRKVNFTEPPAARPSYLHDAESKTYCYLLGELDKVNYDDQCAKCPLVATCRPEVDYLKNVAGDWHAINAASFFGAAFTKATDPYVIKDLRGKAKVGGLLSIYGGSKHALARALNVSVGEAEVSLTGFFSNLPTARAYMDNIKNGLQVHGMVWNQFQRRRDMSRWCRSQAMKPVMHAGPGGKQMPAMDAFTDPEGNLQQVPRMVPDWDTRKKEVSYAERTALNFPIQSTAGELIKMASLDVDALIQRNGWNPLLGPTMPQSLPVGNGAYRSLRFALLSSIHDELLYLIRRGDIDEVIPQVYSAMQLPAVMKALRTGFSLELDVEYDRYGSWTAGVGVPTARIYLLNRLAKEKRAGMCAPNAAIIELADCTGPFIDACNQYVPVEGEARDFVLVVREPGRTFVPPNGQFPRGYIERIARSLSIPYRLALLETQSGG